MNVLLLRARTQRKLTQSQLAHELGVSLVTIGRWEAGAVPSPRLRTALCDFFHRSSASLGLPALGEQSVKEEMLTPQERMRIFSQLEAGEIDLKQAAQSTGKSARQIARWQASYREKGIAALVHGNRGKRSEKRISEEIREQVRSLAKETGCSQQELCRLLQEREGIRLSQASVQRILQEEEHVLHSFPSETTRGELASHVA